MNWYISRTQRDGGWKFDIFGNWVSSSSPDLLHLLVAPHMFTQPMHLVSTHLILVSYILMYTIQMNFKIIKSLHNVAALIFNNIQLEETNKEECQNISL